MTDRFDEISRLKNLLGRREAIVDREKDTRTVNHGIVERMTIEQDIRNAAPWLIKVARAFRPGDANRIGELISVMDEHLGDYYDPHKEVLYSLLRAAKIMEERE